MNLQVGAGHFLDSNVIFDIVYPKRVRHEAAIRFYKEFKNLELAIEPAVQYECNNVVLRYVSRFATEFKNYLAGLEKKGKGWNKTSVRKRPAIMSEFLMGRRLQQSEEDFKPFIVV